MTKNKKGWIGLNIRFLASMIIISAFVNGLFTHIGQTKIFSFPEDWLLIGGNITLESITYGVINGLIIGVLYMAFNIFNLGLNVKQISQLIPGAFQPIALTTTIALTFFPSIQQRAREIKEAQMIRGNPMKKIPDWIPIILPLLVTSLEDAILLSESMTSRGFRVNKNPKRELLTIIAIILATFLLFSGWILNIYSYPRIISFGFYISSGFLFAAALIFNKRGTNVTRYRKETMVRKEILPGTLLTLSSVLFIYLLLSDRINLFYTPYPILAQPEISMSGLLFTIIPLLPLLAVNDD